MSNINNSYVKQQTSHFKSKKDGDLNCDIDSSVMNKNLISPNDVLQLKLPTKNYLCSNESNVYGIEFTRFTLRNAETDVKLFEVAKPTIAEWKEEEETPKKTDPNAARFVRYQFTSDFLRLKTVGATSDQASVDSEATIPHKKNTRKNISLIDKERLVQAYENAEDYLKLGCQLGIKSSTTRNIIHRFQQKNSLTCGKRGGSKSKISDEAKEIILAELDRNPFSTLQEMVNFTKRELGITCCIGTMFNLLHKQMISFKNARGMVEEKNSLRVRLLRKQYVERFLSDEWRMKELIYIDECSFDLWIRCKKGWKKSGERLYVNLPNFQGPNISLVLAIDRKGPVHFNLIRGSYTKETYSQFVMELLSKLDKTNKHYLIHDNASIHTGITTGNNNHIIANLPPYSPFLNPIESVFSKLKSRIRKELTIKININTLTTEQRIQETMKIIETEVKKPDYLNLESYFRHIKKFFVPSIHLEDIFGD